MNNKKFVWPPYRDLHTQPLGRKNSGAQSESEAGSEDNEPGEHNGAREKGQEEEGNRGAEGGGRGDEVLCIGVGGSEGDTGGEETRENGLGGLIVAGGR